MANIKLNSNFSPKIYFCRDTDEEGKAIPTGDFYLIIELSVPCEAFEMSKSTDGKAKTKYKKCQSPLRHGNDLLNYWNGK